MATAGKQNGTLTYLMLDGTQVDNQVELSMDVSQATIDCATKDGNGWDEFLTGRKSATGSGTAYFAEDDTAGYAEFLATITTPTTATIRITTGVSGDTYYEWTAVITQLSMSAPFEEVRSYNFTWQASGAPTTGTEV